ncbi:MAG: MATE family efflux transporter [Lachnospiraceae bacterium]|nr:MATE family efflux transporter [Lachnospiraceae bacterium]
MNKSTKALNTTLDRLPLGEANMSEGLKVSGKLPEGVKSKELYKDIVRIAWPSFVELLLTQLVSMADMMMVGGIGGEANPQLGVDAITAVGLTTQPKFLLMTAFVALNTGVTALIARYKGQGDKEKANLVLRQGMMLTFISTFILSVLGVLFSKPMVIFMGGKGDAIISQATVYLQIQLAGFATVALTSTITAALRAVGDSRTCMVYNMIANIVNVIFNWLLIGGKLGFPELGVAGASIATVIGQLVAFVIALCVILRGNSFLKLELKKGFKPNKTMLSNITAIGIPAAVEQLLMRAGMVIFAKTVASLSDISFATHQVCMNIQALSFMTGQAFAVSATSLVGQSLGRKRSDMAQAYCSKTRNVGFFVALLLTVTFAFWGGDIVSLYNKDPGIIEMGGRIMLFVAFLQPFQTSQFIIAGGLRGAGDTKSTAKITTVTVLFVRPIIAILLVNAGLDLYGAWIALACDQLLRSALVFLRYNSGKWKLIKIKNEAKTS